MGNEIWWVCEVFLEHGQLFCPKLLKISTFCEGTLSWKRMNFSGNSSCLMWWTCSLRHTETWGENHTEIKVKLYFLKYFAYVCVHACLAFINQYAYQPATECSGKLVKSCGAEVMCLNDSNSLSNSGIALLILLCTWKKREFLLSHIHSQYYIW
jgi:hypothetical protein